MRARADTSGREMVTVDGRTTAHLLTPRHDLSAAPCLPLRRSRATSLQETPVGPEFLFVTRTRRGAVCEVTAGSWTSDNGTRYGSWLMCGGAWAGALGRHGSAGRAVCRSPARMRARSPICTQTHNRNRARTHANRRYSAGRAWPHPPRKPKLSQGSVS